MKYIVIVILLFPAMFSQHSVWGQNISPDLIGQFSKKGKIILNDYTKIETSKILFDNNAILYTDSNKQEKSIPYDQINYIRYTKGNRKFFGMAIGAISGSLSGFLGSISYKTYYMEGDNLIYGNNATSKDVIIATSAGLAIGSAIGFSIGWVIPKWHTTLINQKNDALSFGYNIEQKKYYGINCTLNF
ncbi:hypothetical protein GM418_17650 [Maribellus comscasis]|uniref:Uncharacterized protein n=1 Tax=Maribellus comscasis TaxID=2681766 RepID=A0A6I6JWC4_9BACT|nr:hypothetical protein [Maribellus comscasis]QGY45430.1 hypothetical protein GM418_17650 [Maribellus comscasis]